MSDLIIYADKWVAAVLVGVALLSFSLKNFRRSPPDKAVDSQNLAIIGFFVLITIFLPLFGQWMGGRSLPNAVGGLLPWNDAAGYFDCARALINGSELGSFCQRRPQYTTYLATLLAGADGDLQLALVFQSLILVVGVFLLAKEIYARWGFAAAIISVAPLAAFAGNYSATTLTENLGLVFGVIALVFLLNGSYNRQSSTIAAGIFLLTVGLSARAGAFFVLPFLLLWPMLVANSARLQRIYQTLFLMVAVIAGLVIGPIISILIGDGPSGTHANFSYTIFGVVSGGKGWLHVYDAHPEFFNRGLPEKKIAWEIYAASWQVFIESPALMLEGLTKGFLIYLERILKYVPWLPTRIFIVLCWITGIVHILRNTREPTKLMLGLLGLGIVTSAPIIAFDAGTRVYATTIAADATIVALGFFVMVTTIAHYFAPHYNRAISDATLIPPKQLGATNMGFAFLVLIVTLIPSFIGVSNTKGQYTSPPISGCGAESNVAVARLGHGSPVLPIVANGQSTIWPLSPAADDFTSRVNRNVTKANGLRQATPGTTYALIQDLSADSLLKSYLAIATDITIPMDGNVYLVCSKGWPEGPLEGARLITKISPINR